MINGHIQLYLRDGFGLISLLSIVSCNTLSLDSLSLGIFFFIFSKKIDLIIFLGSSSSFASISDEGFTCSARASKGFVLRSIWFDMGVPPRYMGIGRSTRRGRDLFENAYISLRRCIPGGDGINQSPRYCKEMKFFLPISVSRSRKKGYRLNLPFDIRPGRKVLFKFGKIYRHFLFEGDVWMKR